MADQVFKKTHAGKDNSIELFSNKKTLLTNRLLTDRSLGGPLTPGNGRTRPRNPISLPNIHQCPKVCEWMGRIKKAQA